MARLGLALLLGLLGGVALLAVVQGHSAQVIDLTRLLAGPGSEGWLGADELGRDVLARAAAGLWLSMRVSLAVGLGTALVGIPLGLLAGWRGGGLDAALVRLADVVLSFPGLLLALALTALLGPSALNVVIALCLLGWVGFFRLTRVQVMALRGKPYMQAAVLMGVRLPVLLVRHLLPNVAGPLVVEAVVVLAGALVAEAGLSFLGLGVPPPVASLGGMIREGIRYVVVAPHLVVVPSLMLFCLVVGLNVLAEGLRREGWRGTSAIDAGGEDTRL